MKEREQTEQAATRSNNAYMYPAETTSSSTFSQQEPDERARDTQELSGNIHKLITQIIMLWSLLVIYDY